MTEVNVAHNKGWAVVEATKRHFGSWNKALTASEITPQFKKKTFHYYETGIQAKEATLFLHSLGKFGCYEWRYHLLPKNEK